MSSTTSSSTPKRTDLVRSASPVTDSVSATALRTHRLVTHCDVLADLVAGFLDVLAVRVPINQRAFARAAAEQLIDRLVRHLAENVPERDVDGGNRSHRYRAASPVRTAIEKLPDVLDTARVAADEIRYQVVLEIRGDGEFAPIQSGVADTGNTGASDNFEGYEIARGAGDDDFGRHDFAFTCRTHI